MNLSDIISMLFDTGVQIFQSVDITFDDYTINLWWWILGFAVLLLVADIVGRILQ